MKKNTNNNNENILSQNDKKNSQQDKKSNQNGTVQVNKVIDNYDDGIPIQINTYLPKQPQQTQQQQNTTNKQIKQINQGETIMNFATNNRREQEEIKTQIETITSFNQMLQQQLEVNHKVLEADIHELFQFYNISFFDSQLDRVLVEWSTRMTLCAGICYYQKGLCTIRLSKQLLKYRSEKEMQETLIHEMIHAHLFLTKKSYSRDGTDGHGPDFQKKMREINQITGFNISVYHSFNDEVDSYRQHVWLCNGKCRKIPPYYGIVKRSRNMPPGPVDYWWEQHKEICGGDFIKIAEPENYKPIKKKGQDQQQNSNTLDKFLGKQSKDNNLNDKNQLQNDINKKDKADKKRKRGDYENIDNKSSNSSNSNSNSSNQNEQISQNSLGQSSYSSSSIDSNTQIKVKNPNKKFKPNRINDNNNSSNSSNREINSGGLSNSNNDNQSSGYDSQLDYDVALQLYLFNQLGLK